MISVDIEYSAYNYNQVLIELFGVNSDLVSLYVVIAKCSGMVGRTWPW